MFIPAVDKADYATYFMPLDDYDTLSQTLNFVDAHQVDGKAYGIPYMAGAQGVVYNKAVFEKAGITTLPTTPNQGQHRCNSSLHQLCSRLDHGRMGCLPWSCFQW